MRKINRTFSKKSIRCATGVKSGKVICSVCRKKPHLCTGCGAQIDRSEKHWITLKSGFFLCNACHEDPKRLEEPCFCTGCGAQIGRDEKRWIRKDGSGFLCDVCYEERKKAALAQQQAKKQREEQAKEKREDTFVTYLGGFAGVTGTHSVKMHFEASQVIVEDNPLLGKKGQVLWTMPYNKIKGVRIDTAENLTAARLLLTGILALGLKKKDRYLVVSFEGQNGMLQNPVFEGAE